MWIKVKCDHRVSPEGKRGSKFVTSSSRVERLKLNTLCCGFFLLSSHLVLDPASL